MCAGSPSERLTGVGVCTLGCVLCSESGWGVRMHISAARELAPSAQCEPGWLSRRLDSSTRSKRIDVAWERPRGR